jgi:hypothetical protein
MKQYVKVENTFKISVNIPSMLILLQAVMRKMHVEAAILITLYTVC